MRKIKVLFVCIHNSARSQMAEAFLNSLAGDRFKAESAGLEPGVISPLVIEALKEEGIDISGNRAKSVFDMYKRRCVYDYVITVCEQADSGRCPVFPGATATIHWSFKDPLKCEGTRAERLEEVRIIRDQIKHRIERWIREEVET